MPTLSVYALQSKHPDSPQGVNDPRTVEADAFWRFVVQPWVREQAPVFASQVPQAQIVMFEEASHYLYKDALMRVVQVMHDFYDGLMHPSSNH